MRTFWLECSIIKTEQHKFPLRPSELFALKPAADGPGGFYLAKMFCFGTVALLLTLSPLAAQQPDPLLQTDSDHDGLSDPLEQKLLEQLLPRFMIGEHDCSLTPAEFRTGITTPEVQVDNGTIYGQVFPATDETDREICEKSLEGPPAPTWV